MTGKRENKWLALAVLAGALAMIVVGSLVAAVAPSAGALIAARALQGIGGAITTYLGWRWIFWVNVHLGLLVLFGIWKLAPQTTTEHKEHGTDVFGVLLSAIGFGLLVFVLIEGPTWGRLTPKSAAVIGPFTWSANAAFSLIPARGGRISYLGRSSRSLGYRSTAWPAYSECSAS